MYQRIKTKRPKDQKTILYPLCIKSFFLEIYRIASHMATKRGEKMKREDIQVFRDIQKNAELAIKAVDSVIDKVYDDGLVMQLSRQSIKYSQIRTQAADRLVHAHLEPARVSALEELLTAGGLHKDTLLNTSTSHIAQLMIRESNDKISKMYQTLHKNEDAGKEALSMAKGFVDVEEANVRQLRKFL